MRRTLILVGLIGLLTIAVLSAVSPPQQPVPGTDSGVYLYIGERILEGELPYRDAWDHKGPVIYYINALGQFLRSDSRWGVWFLEVLAVSGAGIVGFSLMRRRFGEDPAIFGTGVWLLSLPNVLSSGNLTEEYALPVQFAAMLLLLRSEQNQSWRWSMRIGLSLALGFLLRPNIVGIPLAILLYWFWQLWRGERRQAVQHITALLASATGLILLVWGYFSAAGAGEQMLDAVLTYNFVYSDSNLIEKLASLVAGLHWLQVISVFALAGWGLLLLDLRGGKIKSAPFLGVLGLALPLEFVLTSVSGRTFSHYYMSWLPVMGVLAAYLLYRILSGFAHSELSFARSLSYVLLGAFGILPLSGILPPFIDTLLHPQVDLLQNDRAAVLEYTADNLGEDDRLLFWGSELALNWLTGVPNPSRHIYQAHLLDPAYVTQTMIQEYLSDIITHQPVIIDSTVSEGGLPPLDAPPDRWPDTLRPVYQFVYDNYTFERNLTPQRWPVYRIGIPEP